ncbi:MAG: glycosyltransferase family 39 protein [Sulfurospirillaceae bacterium]|nr:glycosyltransferase family 39 protein [Sulfurospirillaceae bacterium]MDD2827913.1 glycosyltransferase family 39 protein [Sulfurospirillaceae bacterium]
MRESFYLFLILCISGLLLIYGVHTISISYDEAIIFFHGTNLVHYMALYSTKIFGQSDLALRAPFILFHLLSIILLYKIGKLILKRRLDRVLSVAIYALLPGVNSVVLFVNSGSIVIFFTLLFVYLYMREFKIGAYIVLMCSLFIDNSFAILYVALFFYALFNRKKDLLILTFILFSLSMYIYGYNTGGKPKGYFLDTVGVYAIIFSPFLFLYFVYALYRILIKEEKNILWYISFFSLLFSLVLSLRQKLLLEDFAPFVVLAIPLMIKVFFNSYRVRLPQFRKYHNVIFTFVIAILLFNTGLCFLNQPLYMLLKDPSKHFAINYHVAKELAVELKKSGVTKVNIKDDKMALRLKFYGIEGDDSYRLTNDKEVDGYQRKIEIVYYGIKVRTFYLYRIS